MLRTTPLVLGTLSLLLGCSEGASNRPADPSASPGSTTIVPGSTRPEEPGGAPLDDAGAPPLAVATTSTLQPFELAPSKLFSPVQQAERPVPPLSGGTLAVAANGKVVLSDPDRDQVYLVDIDNKRTTTLALQSGDEPGRVAIEGARAYVALRASGALVTIDLMTQRLSARTAVCAAPRGVTFDASAARVLVACAGGDLVSVAADGTKVLSKVRIDADLRDIGRDAQGLWVTQFRAAALLRLNAALQVVERKLPASAKAPPGPPNVVVPAARTPEFSPTLAFRTVAGAGGEAFMVHQRAQTTAVRPDFGGYGAAFGGGFCEGGILHTTVTRFAAGAASAQAALPQAVVPLDLGLSPDGRMLAVIAAGNYVRQDVAPLALDFGSVARGPAQQLFLAPTSDFARADASAPLGAKEGDCLSKAGRWEHRFPGETIAVQFLDARTLLVQVRNPVELHVFRLDAQDNPRLSAIIPLSAIAVRDTGHEVFHQNTGTGIACASCHGEVLDDGHTWEFEGVGVRRTQHLRGGVLANAPYHWSGDLPNFDALLDDVYQKRMGAAVLDVEARAALARWLDRVPLVPTEAADPAAAARGQALFASDAVGCARCHAGETLRTSGSYDVGTGGTFEVPSLHGLSLRLPLMHNGCADTLEKRFETSCGGGDKHGVTSQLSVAQLKDLVSYLGSL